MTASKRIAVLVSGTGSNLQALLDHHDTLGGEIVLVGSDRGGIQALSRAATARVPTLVVPFAGYEQRDAWDAALFDAVAPAEPDLVVLAGFMRVLAPRWVQRWQMINTHPSLLPAFPGARAVADALDYGVKVTGVTVHFVVEEVDAGPVIRQEQVLVRDDDDVDSLHERIKAVEHQLLATAVYLFCNDRLAVNGRHVRMILS